MAVASHAAMKPAICYGKENLLQFNKSKNTCSFCRNLVEFIPDLPVNVWKFDDSARKMTVMMERQGGEARRGGKEAGQGSHLYLQKKETKN